MASQAGVTCPQQVRGARPSLADHPRIIDEGLQAREIEETLIPSEIDVKYVASPVSMPENNFKRFYHPQERAATSTVMRSYGGWLGACGTRCKRNGRCCKRLVFLFWPRIYGDLTGLCPVVRVRIDKQRLPTSICASLMTGEEVAKVCGLRPITAKEALCQLRPKWALAGNAVSPLLLFEVIFKAMHCADITHKELILRRKAGLRTCGI